MAEFVTVCKVGAIDDGSSAIFPVGDVLVAVFRDKDDYFAINDFCPHMGASLGEGHFENGYVTCPWHAWSFCVRSGELCDNPAMATESYRLRVVDDEIQVCIEPEDGKSGEGEPEEEEPKAP